MLSQTLIYKHYKCHPGSVVSFYVSPSCLLPLYVSQRRPLFLTEFQFGWNWKQVWLCFFILWGVLGFSISVGLFLMLVSLNHWLVGNPPPPTVVFFFFYILSHLLHLSDSSISQVVTHSENHVSFLSHMALLISILHILLNMMQKTPNLRVKMSPASNFNF